MTEEEDDGRLSTDKRKDDNVAGQRRNNEIPRGGLEMTKLLHGKVHGKTIELTEEVGVPEGQEVEIQLRIVEPSRKWGDGILRTAGALADDPFWDAIMEEIQQGRKIERRQQLEDEWQSGDSK